MKVGIYDNYDECEKYTKGYIGAHFKKFLTKEEC